MKALAAAAMLLLAACTTVGADPPQVAPRVDYHQHLVSPAFAPIAKLPERNGGALLAELDAAGIERAIVLSVAYSYGDERKALANPDALTRAENDWTSAEVNQSRGRLIGFCSANPLRPAALEEIDRCLAMPGMIGIKLHLGNAGISLRNPDHLRTMQEVFALAERRRAPVLVHMRARGGIDYGAEDARLFLAQVVPHAPSVEIVVAHLGASSPGYPAQNDEVMAVFGAAAERNDPAMRNLYFDPAANITADLSAEDAALAVRRMRQVGVDRILYGSDLSPPGGSIRSGWDIFRTKLPLTRAELRRIASNRARFAR